jgi:hypothetical protein
MDYLGVLRDKIRLFREEIAAIQELNGKFRRNSMNGGGVQVAHLQRSERLQAIQHELGKLARLGGRVVSTKPMKEQHHSPTRCQTETSSIEALKA